MHKNKIWLAFFLFVIGVTLWFSFKAGIALYQYNALDEQALIRISSTQIEQLGRDQYVVMAQYSYDYQNETYEKHAILGSVYPNPWAAQKVQKRLNQQNHTIWFNAKRPRSSSLHKAFPYKTTISAALLIGLVIYFASIGIYAKSNSL